jgi:hypothetical protein
VCAVVVAGVLLGLGRMGFFDGAHGVGDRGVGVVGFAYLHYFRALSRHFPLQRFARHDGCGVGHVAVCRAVCGHCHVLGHGGCSAQVGFDLAHGVVFWWGLRALQRVCGWVALLASVCDEVRMHEIMDTWKPHTVYHAAAYKHVPLVEHNPAEGVRNNVWGTRVCAEAAMRSSVRNFV